MNYELSKLIDLGQEQISFEPVMVKIEDIILDDKNPNKMTENQADALSQAIASDQGLDAYPVIQRHELDGEGKIVKRWAMKVADGEHRVVELKKKGVLEIPVILRDMSEPLRIQIRQTHNKVSGQHDPLLDAQEFLWIKEQGLQQHFQIMLGISDLEFEKILAGQNVDIPVDNTQVSISGFVEHKCVVPGCNHGQEESKKTEQISD